MGPGEGPYKALCSFQLCWGEASCHPAAKLGFSVV